MTASSGRGFKKTATTPTPRQFTGLKKRGENGTWLWTKEAKQNAGVAPESSPSTSLLISSQGSDKLNHRNFLLLSPFLKRKSRQLLSQWNRRSRCLCLGRTRLRSNTDSSFALDSNGLNSSAKECVFSPSGAHACLRFHRVKEISEANFVRRLLGKPAFVWGHELSGIGFWGVLLKDEAEFFHHTGEEHQRSSQ